MGLVLFILAGLCMIPAKWITSLNEDLDKDAQTRLLFWFASVCVAAAISSMLTIGYFSLFQNRSAGFVEIPPGVMLYGAPILWALGFGFTRLSSRLTGAVGLCTLVLGAGCWIASLLLPLALIFLTRYLISFFNIHLHP